MLLLGRNRPPEPKASWRERVEAVRDAIWIILLPVLIAVLIYGGIATPTEAAGAAVVYAFFCATFVYRGRRQGGPWPGAGGFHGQECHDPVDPRRARRCFAYALTILHIPQNLTEAALERDLSPIGVLLIINGVLIVLGMFLDIISILLITAPIVLPVVTSIGIDPIHFGMIFVLNMELALITPPLGIHSLHPEQHHASAGHAGLPGGDSVRLRAPGGPGADHLRAGAEHGPGGPLGGRWRNGCPDCSSVAFGSSQVWL